MNEQIVELSIIGDNSIKENWHEVEVEVSPNLLRNEENTNDDG